MRQVSHTAAFELDQPVEVLFPLFSPEGERRWVPGWDYINLMGSSDLREDYLFLTRDHDHAARDAIWLVKRYAPEEHTVEFYKIEPGEKVGVVKVSCSALTARRTRVQVGYTYMALSPAGERFIETFSADAYRDFIGEWEALLAAYFEGRAGGG